ncbi:MAG: hypothetical protein LUE27_07020 [Clostridia bacterium]|nr:hypothetical protein [Clostridia bacterium]
MDSRKDSSARAVRWGTAAAGRGNRKRTVLAICGAAVIVCVVAVLWCLLVFTGSEATDPRA